MKQTKIELIFKESKDGKSISIKTDDKVDIHRALSIIQMAQNSTLEKVREICPQKTLNSELLFRNWIETKTMKYLIQEVNKSNENNKQEDIEEIIIESEKEENNLKCINKKQ